MSRIRYTFLHQECWRLRVDGTRFVRDAKVELEQCAKRASEADVGVLPLANFVAEYHPSRPWRILAQRPARAERRPSEQPLVVG